MTQMPDDIRTLIPHADAMCLLDSVVYVDDQRIQCLASSHRKADNPLRRADGLSTQTGIEYAAQAIAAHGSLRTRKYGADIAPRKGMIASITDIHWSIDRLDTTMSDLTITAVLLAELPQGQDYHFTIEADQHCLLTGNMVIALQPDDAV